MDSDLDLKTVESEVEPIATEYLQTVSDSFRKADFDVSEIGKRDDSGGIVWDITVETEDTTSVISFSLVDSREYEGEMFGYNISVDAVSQSGKVLVKYTPQNFTDNVWTTELSTLIKRANKIPKIKPDDLN